MLMTHPFNRRPTLGSLLGCRQGMPLWSLPNPTLGAQLKSLTSALWGISRNPPIRLWRRAITADKSRDSSASVALQVH
jgi:hypothetical protein